MAARNGQAQVWMDLCTIGSTEGIRIHWYLQCDYELAAAQLVFTMLGMGSSLRMQDFLTTWKAPRLFGLGIFYQLVLVPLIVVGIIKLTRVPTEVAIGFAIIASLPGGSLSNILVYVGRGNVPLSVSLTAMMSLVCLVSTPMILEWLLPLGEKLAIEMPRLRIVSEMVGFLLVPLALGMMIRQKISIWRKFSQYCIRLSLVLLGTIVVGSFTSGRIDFSDYHWSTTVTIVGFAMGVNYVGRIISWASRTGLAAQMTLAVETTLKNINLGVLLVASVFNQSPLEGAVLFVLLVYGGTAIIINGIEAMISRKVLQA